MLPLLSEYGQCPCQGVFERRYVEVRMTVGGEPVTLTDIPQGSCPQCGGRVYKAGVIEELEAMMRNEGPPDRPLLV